MRTTPAGTLTNEVDVTSLRTTDSNSSNNANISTTTTVETQADLAIEKVSDPDKVYAGEQKKYTISVENLGPSTAYTVTVTDTLPVSVTYEIDTASCSVSAGVGDGQVLTCTKDTLVAGGVWQFDIWVRVDADTSPDSKITNVAATTASTTLTLDDPDASNNTASASNLVLGKADLKIRKFGKPDGQVEAGDLLTYTVIVDNLGPGYAHDVVVTDTLVSSGEFQLVDTSTDRGDVCTPDSGSSTAGSLEITCSLSDTLEPQSPTASGRWTIEIVVTADQTQDINNVAHVVSDDFDPNTDNNEAYVEHDITDVADLAITKSATPAPVTAGTSLTYTLRVTNDGPSTAENVVVQDRLPAPVIVTAFETSQGDCNTGSPGEAQDKLTCGLGDLAVDGSATVTVAVGVPSWVPDGTILENDALVFSDIFDDNNANDFTTDLTTVNASADLSVSKRGEPNPVVAGELLEYTVTVTNTGPSDAVGVIVTDTLPADVEFQRIRDPYSIGVTCSLNPIDERTLTCTVGTLEAHDVARFTIVVLVDSNAATPLNNQIEVGSATSDPASGNNTGDDGTGVDREEQLFIRKTDAPDPVLAGEELIYTVTFGNNGPSTATSVVVTDTLPLGLTFERCESLDPNGNVTCELISGDGNNTQQIVRVNEIRDAGTVVYKHADSPNDQLDPGEQYTFQLIAGVESGYVLNGRGDTGDGELCRSFFLATDYPFYAHNRIDIAGDQDAASDDECTRVETEADLALDLSDGVNTPVLSGTNAAALEASPQADPVAPQTTATYTVTVTNNGPSDAAESVVTVQLSPAGLALDPALVDVTIAGGRGAVEEINHSGRITILAGDDPDNSGAKKFGRINAGSDPVVITIEVIVTQDAACGSAITTTASVETRRNNVEWEVVVDDDVDNPTPPTPTEDPDLSNNEDSEETTIVCPAITIDKTVSLDGACPGTNNVAIGFLGEPVTYCYEVTNTGDTYLDTITITDTITTRSGPEVIFEETFNFDLDGDPNLPLSPGASFITHTTVPDTGAFIDCNTRPNTAVVTADPVNRGRARLVDVPPVRDSDGAVVETPCKGVDWRLQLPALNTDECETWIQVQNAGNVDTKALLVLWGEPGACPPQAFGPLKVECTGLLRPGSAWSFAEHLLPAGARSGIVYSMNGTDRVLDKDDNELLFADLACGELFALIRQNHDQWLRFDEAYRRQGVFYGPSDISGRRTVLDFGVHQGEPLAVTVNRTCPDPIDPNLDSSAAYVGISTDREGVRDPRGGQFAYYAPLVWADYAGMNSQIHIQNSGVECTSVELWFQQQGDCIRPVIWDVLAIAPGESYVFDPNEVVGPQWKGSVWLRTSQPMGVIVDTLGANHFGSYHGVPADVFVDGGAGDFSLGTQVNYAPLIYREHQGWETSIQVQNLSSTYNAKVKVSFLDDGGDVIKTIVDWICPRGSQTFFLPMIAGLPGNWAGAARVESQDWFSPGDPSADSARILSVVLLEKYTDPAKTARQEAVLYNALQEMGSFDWQLGPGARTGFGGSDVLGVPFAAKQNRGVTSEIAVQNLNPNSGFTDFVIFIYDQNGIIDYVCEKLNEKQVEYIDLDEWGIVRPGFLGSVVISSTYTNQNGGAALGAVAVERIGRVQSEPDIPGDESKAFEAFPLFNRFFVEESVSCPGQP